MKITMIWVLAISAMLIMGSVDLSDAAKDKSGVLKASDIIGKRVEDTAGKKLGDIKDLVIDPDGDIQYLVLDFGGFLGIGDKYFAVPWEAMQLDQKNIKLDVTKRDLKNAPGFDKEHWPDFSDQKMAVTIYEFYEVPVPSEGGGTR